MTKFIPVFPLEIVVFPGELLHLHIFESRYRQLINDCFTENKPFGIPVVLSGRPAEMGTLLKIVEIVKVYEDGKMDIKTEGLKVFRVLEMIPDIPEKKYSGAIVNFPENDESLHPIMAKKIIEGVRTLHGLLNIHKDFKKADNLMTSYDLAHHAGMSLQQEFEILNLFKEVQRLEYLRRHLKKVLPIVAGMENLKHIVQLNGHFKELKGFNFDK